MNNEHKDTWISSIKGIGLAAVVGLIWLVLFSTIFSYHTPDPFDNVANVFRNVVLRMPAGASHY